MTNEIVKDRGRVYGDPLEHFPRVAQVWSGILNTEVSAIQVALCMIGLKVIRTEECPTYSDNSDDVEGYLDIVRQLVGPDMIQARSTQEYLDKLAGLWRCPNPACECRDEDCGCHLDPNRCAAVAT
jgi:hypothetical protein